MLVLVAGLAIFLGIHSLAIVAPGARDRWAAALGANGWRAGYSLISLVGFALLVYGYGLARHKGYSTPEHTGALAAHGLTPLHRLSFAPVRCRSLFPVDSEQQMDLFDEMAIHECL